MTTEWFLKDGASITGPLTTDQLKAMGKSGRVLDGMEVAKARSGPWHRAAAVSGLVVLPATTPAQRQDAATPTQTTVVVNAPKAGHVTTEATRKFIKVQRLVALVIMFIGMGLMAFGGSQGNTPNAAPAAVVAAFGFLLLLIGITWRVILRVLHWWHHA